MAVRLPQGPREPGVTNGTGEGARLDIADGADGGAGGREPREASEKAAHLQILDAVILERAGHARILEERDAVLRSKRRKHITTTHRRGRNSQ